jgi:predicted DCC family thiol-disulfide oxidoreductase YuxK
MAPMLVYDGDCSFCSRWAQWVAGRWRGPERAVAWQQLAALPAGLDAADVREAAWWIGADGSRSRGHLAIAYALRAAPGWPSLLGRVLLVPPFRWLARFSYPLVARWRHRLPGGTPACR